MLKSRKEEGQLTRVIKKNEKKRGFTVNFHLTYMPVESIVTNNIKNHTLKRR